MAQPIAFPTYRPVPSDPFERIEEQLSEIRSTMRHLAEDAVTRDAAIARVESGLREAIGILAVLHERMDGGTK